MLPGTRTSPPASFRAPSPTLSQDAPENTVRNEVSLLSRPYAERQFIVVVDDAVAEAERQGITEADVAENAPRWMEVAKITSRVLASTVAGAVGSLVIELALDTVMSINKLRDRGVDVLTVARSQTRDLDAPI
jgi:hypothetical protein